LGWKPQKTKIANDRVVRANPRVETLMTENDITAEALIDHFEKFQQQFDQLRPAELAGMLMAYAVFIMEHDLGPMATIEMLEETLQRSRARWSKPT
jgi:hypothetical protein